MKFYTFRLVVFSLFVLAFVGCTAPTKIPPDQRTQQVSPLETPKEVKVLSYNVLHGLKVGKYWVSRGESPERNLERFHLQVEQLVQAQPDLVFLQEVNPLPERAKHYVTALSEQGRQYSQIHQVDSCGWRFSKNFALMKELNNGLVILGKPGFVLREIEGLKLSGVGGCHDSWGIQFGELRYALIGEIVWPGTDEKFLVVNVHLHSGIESDAHFLKELFDSHQQGRLHHYDQLQSALVNDQSKRLGELRTLSHELNKLIAQKNYAGVMIGGDFNFERNSPGFKEMVGLGAVDSETIASSDKKVYTIDPESDVLAKEDAETISSDLKALIADESSEDQQEILTDYRANIHRPRKVDFVFILPIDSHIVPKKLCVKQEAFGLETDSSGLSGSDHYGILNTYTLSGSRC